MPAIPVSSTSTSHLEREIRAQPEMLRARHLAAHPHTAAAAKRLSSSGLTHLLLVGRGSSGNAAAFGQYLLADAFGVPAYRVRPSLFESAREPRISGAGLLAISQSGQADDLVAAIRTAAEHGCPTVALTNDLDSPLADAAHVAIPLLAGAERSVPATKTFTATLHALVQLAVCAGADHLAAGLERLPELVEQVTEAAFAELPPVLADLPGGPHHRGLLTAVGQCTGLATAAETALKIREVAGWPAEALSVPDLLHGPVAALGPDSVVWLVESGHREADYWPTVRERLHRTGARVVSVAAPPASSIVALPDGVPDWLVDIVAVVPGQVAALQLGTAAGRDVDRPDGLTKVTFAP